MNQENLSNTKINDKSFLINKFFNDINRMRKEIFEESNPLIDLISKLEECADNIIKLKCLLEEVYISMDLCQNFIEENGKVRNSTVTFSTDLKDLMEPLEKEDDGTPPKKKRMILSLKKSDGAITNDDLDDIRIKQEQQSCSRDNGDNDKKSTESTKEDSDDENTNNSNEASNTYSKSTKVLSLECGLQSFLKRAP